MWVCRTTSHIEPLILGIHQKSESSQEVFLLRSPKISLQILYIKWMVEIHANWNRTAEALEKEKIFHLGIDKKKCVDKVQHSIFF